LILGSLEAGFPASFFSYYLLIMHILSDFDAELISGGFAFPSAANIALGINVSPITIVTPITQVNTVATTAVLAGILDNVNLAVSNTAFNFATV
jgi:hypothetical protein